jgi:integrase
VLRDKKKGELRDNISGKLPGKTLTELKDALDVFMAESRRTIQETKDSLRKLIDLCGERWLEHVDKGLILDFRAKLLKAKGAIATVNKHVRGVRSALSYAVEGDSECGPWIRYNPLLKWKDGRLVEPEKHVRVVEPAEFAKLLAACPNPTFRVLLITTYHQGLRRNEATRLRWFAVDLEGGVLHVLNNAEAAEFTKSRKNRTLPMHPTVKRELKALRKDIPTVVKDGRAEPKYPHLFTWPDGSPYLGDWVSHEFSRIAERAKVDCTFHDLRRSFSTLAQRAGVDRNVIRDLGGWSSVKVLERHYLGEIPTVHKQAMQRIARAQGAA